MKNQLSVIYDSRKSFYGKANVQKNGNITTLTSYSTVVAQKIGNTITVKGWYSTTTARHINEFLQQNGLDRMSKKEMQSKPVVTLN
jgi:hypothetical protein